MNKCINSKDICYCNQLRECKNCKGNNIKDEKCIISSKDFCTCRLCGNAVRADGYRSSFKSNV